MHDPVLKGNVFSVEAPNFADLVVTKTEPGLAGNTATNTLKPATLETGAEVRVPLFINEGDKISIDTRTGDIWAAPRADPAHIWKGERYESL